MGLGIALAGLSGAGQAMGEELQLQDRFDQEQQLLQQKSDLDAQKAVWVAQRTAQANADQADAQRTQINSLVSAAMQPRLDQMTLKNAMADPDFAKSVSGTPDINSLSADQRAKYAPTADQQADARLMAQSDVGVPMDQGLLQSRLADKAQQANTALQDKLIGANRTIAQLNRDATAKAAAASANVARGSQALQLGLGALQSQDQALQGLQNNFKQAYQSFINITPTLQNGSANPKYGATLQQLHDSHLAYNEAVAQANAARAQLGQQFGLPPAVVAPHAALSETIVDGTGRPINLYKLPPPDSDPPAAQAPAPAPAPAAGSHSASPLALAGD